jgi:hypothetical protein
MYFFFKKTAIVIVYPVVENEIKWRLETSIYKIAYATSIDI